MKYEQLPNETREEYLERVFQEDDTFLIARAKRKSGQRIHDILTDDFIEYCLQTGLSQRNIAKLVGVGKSTIGDYMLAFKKKRGSGYEIYTDDFDIKDIKLKYPHGGKMGGREIDNVFLMLSDIQAGAMITAEGFDGDPEATVKYYFDEITAKIIDALSSRNLQVKTFNIMMLGDMVEGWKIFPKQLTIQVRPQMNLIIKCVLSLISDLASQKNIEKVHVYGVLGNHGRVSWNHSTTDNWDQIAYDRIHEKIKDFKQFGVALFEKIDSFMDTDNAIQVHQIGNWRYAISHGDQLRSFSDGTLRRMMHDIQFTNGLHDALLLGHWHNTRWMPYNGIHILINGCTYDSEFNKYRIIKKADIAQLMFGASDDQAVAWIERLNLE